MKDETRELKLPHLIWIVINNNNSLEKWLEKQRKDNFLLRVWVYRSGHPDLNQMQLHGRRRLLKHILQELIKMAKNTF